MEEENKKARLKARREFSEQVRHCNSIYSESCVLFTVNHVFCGKFAHTCLCLPFMQIRELVRYIKRRDIRVLRHAREQRRAKAERERQREEAERKRQAEKKETQGTAQGVSIC